MMTVIVCGSSWTRLVDTGQQESVGIVIAYDNGVGYNWWIMKEWDVLVS